MSEKLPVTPIGPVALIKPLEVKETTPGGIQLPDQLLQKIQGKGTILAFGSGLENQTIKWDDNSTSTVKVGQMVVMKPHSGYEVLHEGLSEAGTTKWETYLIIRLTDIIAVQPNAS